MQTPRRRDFAQIVEDYVLSIPFVYLSHFHPLTFCGKVV